MKLTIEGKPDEIKSMFGDTVMNKGIDSDKIVKAIKESLNGESNRFQRKWGK